MVEQRLALVYDDARFRIFEQDGYTTAEVTLPARERMGT